MRARLRVIIAGVAAINAIGAGPWSDVLTAHTLASVPTPPHGLHCKSLTSDSLCIGWEAPECDNGAPVVEYTVCVRGRRGAAREGRDGLTSARRSALQLQRKEGSAFIYVHSGPDLT